MRQLYVIYYRWNGKEYRTVREAHGPVEAEMAFKLENPHVEFISVEAAG